MSLEKEKTIKETVFALNEIKRFDSLRFNINSGLSGCVLLGEGSIVRSNCMRSRVPIEFVNVTG
jgi:hypothetical protein